jgi:hypothetical protein
LALLTGKEEGMIVYINRPKNFLGVKYIVPKKMIKAYLCYRKVKYMPNIPEQDSIVTS